MWARRTGAWKDERGAQPPGWGSRISWDVGMQDRCVCAACGRAYCSTGGQTSLPKLGPCGITCSLHAPPLVPSRDGEASRVHLIEAAEAFLAQHPQEGYCGQRLSGGVGGAPYEVRVWGTWRVHSHTACSSKGSCLQSFRLLTVSPYILCAVPILLATQQGFKPVQLEAPESSVGLGGEGSCPSEPGSPVLVGAAAVRLDGVTGGVGWWGSVGCLPHKGKSPSAAGVHRSAPAPLLHRAGSTLRPPIAKSAKRLRTLPSHHFLPAVERLEGKACSDSMAGTAGSAGGKGAEHGEHRWGAPWATQVALLFRRSLRTRRFQASAWGGKWVKQG